MKQAVIALGSNIDPEQNIQKALNFLRKEFSVMQETDFIQTKPVGFPDQPDFLNGSVLIETDDAQSFLKERLKEIEIVLGRRHSDIRFGPRTIDLDIVVYNNVIVDKDFYERDFIRSAALKLLPELEY